MFNVTDAQKEQLLAGRLRQEGSHLFSSLYVAEVPSPSPLLGFEENIVEVLQWMVSFSRKVGNSSRDYGSVWTMAGSTGP